jgi:hypothetical protein
MMSLSHPSLQRKCQYPLLPSLAQPPLFKNVQINHIPDGSVRIVGGSLVEELRHDARIGYDDVVRVEYSYSSYGP